MTNEINIASLKRRHSFFVSFDLDHFKLKKNNCILHNTQGTVLKFSQMMRIILNICDSTRTEY